MIARYNNLSLALGVPGFILQVVGLIIQRSAGKEELGLIIVIVGTVLLVSGLAFYAMAKGRSPAWCLMGFLGLIGLIVLACLSEVEPTRKKRKIRRPRFEEEDEDERPTKKRRRPRIEDEAEEDYEDERPARRRRPAREDEDEDYEEERSGKRRRPAIEDEEDEEEERPVKKRRPPVDEDEEEEEREERVQKPAKGPPSRPAAAAAKDASVVRCSNCQKSLRVPATVLGKKVKCPACGTAFVAG
jgi:hypothetical protein